MKAGLNIGKETMKKALGKTQTLRVGRSKPKILPRRRPLPRGTGRPKFKSAGDGHYLHLQTQFGENRCTQFRVIVVTDTAHHKHTNAQTGSITIHCTAS